jgi:hypothetical protein
MLLQAAAQQPGSDAGVELLTTLVWPTFILVLLIVFRRELNGLLRGFTDRLHAGAPMKLGAIELGAIRVDRLDPSAPEQGVRRDIGDRSEERNAYYAASKHLMLVHRIVRSRTDGQLFDVLVYVSPHEDQGSIADVVKVEYFLGRFWKNLVFTSSERHAGFPIVFSAYGPTLCSAKIHFTDRSSTIVHRYLDFEMGATAPLRPADG